MGEEPVEQQREEAPRPRSLSPSRAADYRACPLRYRFRHVDHLPEPSSSAAVRGTVVHRVLERIFDLPPPVRTPRAARTLVEQAWADVLAVEPDAAEVLAPATSDAPDLDTFLESCREVLDRWFSLEDPRTFDPADRERMLETDLPSGLRLRGIVDRVDVAGDGSVRIVDYKTGRAPGVGFEAEALLQLRFYALVLWRSDGVLPRQLRLIYLGSGETVSWTPDEHQLLATERLLDALGDALWLARETGDWQPRPGRTCRFCSFHELCPTYGGTPPPLPDQATPAS